jgi:hypothetical protein
MPTTFTALYDANVLYPAPLRDLLMRLALEAVKKQRDALKNPAKSVEELLDTLSRQQLPMIVSRLRAFAAML